MTPAESLRHSHQQGHRRTTTHLPEGTPVDFEKAISGFGLFILAPAVLMALHGA